MEAKRGHPLPLGTTHLDEGVNFALFSKHATSVKLCLFKPQDPEAFFQIALDPVNNKTGQVWHVLLKDLPDNLEYGFYIDGPQHTEKGYLFNPKALVTDPFAKSLNFPNQWNKARPKEVRGKVILKTQFNWENDLPPKIPMKDLIIYEMHVRGFTQHSSSQAKQPGTYLGLIEKIPHLKALGVNAVELLPVFEFNECEYGELHPKTKMKLVNYWGYSTINFFSPMNRYAFSAEREAAINEFKTMVKELHKNGIEVILDVVFNHTAEGGKRGPYYSFRGIDNPIYYMVDEGGDYRDYTGCSNTFNCNHPAVAEMILDSLRYWVTEMHVDGFRFDLASVLTRNEKGAVLSDPFVIAAMALDPVLANVKLIAEAWDAVGLYQVGFFPHPERWAEWNGKYRDHVRDFIKGTPGYAGHFAHALLGSEDLYGFRRSPCHSINFVTAHDGFSLYDLVSYNDKHNEGNGEQNRDGTNDNRSWNCGAEGETTNPEVLKLREKQIRNLHLALMVSLGTPMILMGDEYAHTRLGNNNTWCQDNELNWFLWNQCESKKDFLRFYSLAIGLRKRYSALSPSHYPKDEDVQWHGQTPFQANWRPDSKLVAFTLSDKIKNEDLYIAFNANWHHVMLELPSNENNNWFRIVDTSRTPPDDFVENPASQPPVSNTYELEPYSAIVFVSFPST